jgi:6-phosphogluconolactonase
MDSRTFSGEELWIESATAELEAAAERARFEGRGSLSLCLAGGRTPEPVYRAMAARSLPGFSVELWLGDERAVAAGQADRNDAMIERAFAHCAWERAPRLHPWPLDLPAAAEAAAAQAAASARLYDAELRASLGDEPAFDLAILGLGADGHTASLFPGEAALDSASGALAAVTRSPLPPRMRLTLTPRALRQARRRLFLVRGADKLPALRALEAEDPAIPASLLAGPGSLVLYLK